MMFAPAIEFGNLRQLRRNRHTSLRNFSSLTWAIFAIVSLIIVAASPPSASTLPATIVGTHSLYENQANQIVQIFATGGQTVVGLDFSVQIGDGGGATAGTGFGTVSNAPKMTALDVVTGTIFASNHSSNGSPTLKPNG